MAKLTFKDYNPQLKDFCLLSISMFIETIK